MRDKNTCGNCCFCIKEEGEPYFCALRDLYYLVRAEDKACEEFVRCNNDGVINNDTGRTACSR